MGCFLDDLRAFGINTDQWTTAAQGRGGWRKTAEQGAKRFMAKWIAAEKARAGLRHAIVYPNVTGRTKERIVQSKRVRAGSFSIIDKRQVVQTCMLQALGLQMSCFISLVLHLFCFCFISFSSLCLH